MPYVSLVGRTRPTPEQARAAVQAFTEDRASFLDLVGGAPSEAYDVHIRWHDGGHYPLKPIAAFLAGLRCSDANTDAFRNWARFEEMGLEIVRTPTHEAPSLRDLVRRAGLDPIVTRLYRHTFPRRREALAAGRDELGSTPMLRLLDCGMFDLPALRPTFTADIRHVVHCVADDAAGDNVVAAVVDITGQPVPGSVVAWFNREQEILRGLVFPYAINRPASEALRGARFRVARGTERNPLMRLDDAARFVLTAAPAGDSEPSGETASAEVAPATDLGLTARRAGTALLRPEQAAFRREMLRLYRHRCAITGCADGALLAACHVVASADGRDDNRQTNGLLLTHNLHALFDRRRLTLHPMPDGTHEVRICGPRSSEDVVAAHGSRIRLPHWFSGRLVEADPPDEVPAPI